MFFQNLWRRIMKRSRLMMRTRRVEVLRAVLRPDPSPSSSSAGLGNSPLEEAGTQNVAMVTIEYFSGKLHVRFPRKIL